VKRLPLALAALVTCLAWSVDAQTATGTPEMPTASDLEMCLAQQRLVRVARVLEASGRVVYGRVVEARNGRPRRYTPIADAGTPLARVFELAALPPKRTVSHPLSPEQVCPPVDLTQAQLDAETHVIVSTGLNYAAHAEEAGGGDVFLFPKPAAPTRPYARVHPPAGVTLLDYEIELAYVLLEPVDLAEPPSREALLENSAFFLSNDLSDRQPIILGASLTGGSTGFVEGKGQPGFFPAGPWMVRGRELFSALRACRADGLGLRLWVDEGDGPVLRQSASTALMIQQPHELIAYLGDWIARDGLRTPMPFERDGETRYYPLAVGEEPPRLGAGSIVQTGTPEGVALQAPSPLGVMLRGLVRLRGPFAQFAAEEQARVATGKRGGYLQAGDVVHAWIDGLGVQEFALAPAGSPTPPDPCATGGAR